VGTAKLGVPQKTRFRDEDIYFGKRHQSMRISMIYRGEKLS
jgi:hypothetical protein